MDCLGAKYVSVIIQLLTYFLALSLDVQFVWISLHARIRLRCANCKFTFHSATTGDIWIIELWSLQNQI
jgi:hypothetical protein